QTFWSRYEEANPKETLKLKHQIKDLAEKISDHVDGYPFALFLLGVAFATFEPRDLRVFVGSFESPLLSAVHYNKSRDHHYRLYDTLDYIMRNMTTSEAFVLRALCLVTINGATLAQLEFVCRHLGCLNKTDAIPSFDSLVTCLCSLIERGLVNSER